MGAIFMVLFLGTAINVANTHPHSIQDASDAVYEQLSDPVIEPADPSKYNQ